MPTVESETFETILHKVIDNPNQKKIDKFKLTLQERIKMYYSPSNMKGNNLYQNDK